MKLTIQIFLFIYIIYALLKFYEFFYRKESTKQKGLEMVYDRQGGKIIKIFDNVMYVLMAVLVIMLFTSGVEYLSFIAGLLVGMTLIQIYFHRFNAPLPPDKMPKPPITALKMASYSIQAQPSKAWRELLFMTVLFIWALYELTTLGFGWF
jgi:hypothetical protein